MRHALTWGGLVLACSLGLATASDAAEYHVAPQGDDTNPGTAALPWRTLAMANANLEPGDTVWIHAGSYDDPIRPTRDGTADDNRIVYRAFGDGDVVLTGFPGSGTPQEGALALGEKRYVTVSGRAPGDPITAQRIRLEPPTDINSLGNVCGSEGVIVENIYAECSHVDRNCNRGFGFCTNFWDGDYETRFNILRNSTFIGRSDTSQDPNDYTEDLVMIAHRAHHNLIENNELSNCKHATLYADSPTSHSNVIRGNRITNPQHTGLSIWSAGVDLPQGARFLVENNTLGGSGRTVQPEGGPGNAFQWGSDELIIRHNVITQGGSADQQTTSIGGLSGATSTSFGSPYFATDGRIYHNAIVDNRGVAIGLFDFGVDPVDLGRHRFVNNLIYGSSSASTGELLAVYWDGDYATGDRHVRNVWGNPAGAANQEILQNAHHGAVDLATAIANWRNPEDPELTDEAGLANVYDASPGFVDYAGGDFRLIPGSPYVDGAAPLTRVAVGDSGSGTLLEVLDPRVFFAEADEFPPWMGVQSEWIAVGETFATAARVQIASVDDSLGQLVLAQPITRQPGDAIWLWRDSSGREVSAGAAPDIGPFEHLDTVFTDGFESGDVTAWSQALD
ncbi:MAG: right-handed parallel beta-helix repeat-containing protein [Acidobacteriota bacterium]